MSRPVRRVSSHAMTSASRRVSRARGEMSLKFPMGVATTVRRPPVADALTLSPARGFTDQNLQVATIIHA